MDYTIDIIDTENNEVILSLEKAVSKSVVLSWQGGDNKDELFVVGSSLKFTLVGMSCEDAQYQDLFTGDETRYRVILYDESSTIWNGFILPDRYSEPYSDSPILIDFEAADGLGRLKGKFLPDDFYEEEKSVIQVIGKCLELTGVDMKFRFAPAIENSLEKDYTKIYVDTSLFAKKEKKDDAYKILNELLESMLCTVYQADNFWNVEGFNIRNQRVYITKEYNYNGFFLGEYEVTRLTKEVTGVATPNVEQQPPYGFIEVAHEREPLALPEALSQEENEGWWVQRNLSGFIYANEWRGVNNFYAYAKSKQNSIGRDYGVYFERETEAAQVIRLRTRPYLQARTKYKLKLEFKIISIIPLDEAEKQDLIDNGFWTNPFDLKIFTSYKEDNNVIQDTLFANYGVPTGSNKYLPLEFDLEGISENTIEFSPNASGLLEIQISPVKDELNRINRIEIQAMELEEIAFSDELLATKQLNEEYTLTKEIDLVYADDNSGFSRGFRLAKLTDKSTYTVRGVEIIRQTFRDGYHYAIVNLMGANLIKDNIDEVYVLGNKINVLEVIYNYNNAQEHWVKLDSPISVGDFDVYIYDYNAVTENRDHWQEWSDSLYKIERIRYPDAVVNIYNRLVNTPIAKMPNFRVKNNVKFNDFLNFTYVSKKDWILTNCKWIIDEGYSEVSTSLAYYAVTPGENLPPVVEAGPSIYFDDTTATLNSEAYDPDGFIASYLWHEITNNGATINAPNNADTIIGNLTEDYYVFQVTVTDNDGATATDTVEVFRVTTHNASTQLTNADLWLKKYKLIFSPEINTGASVNVKGTFNVLCDIGNPNNDGGAAFRLSIDGTYVENREFGPMLGGDYSRDTITEDFNRNYAEGEEWIFEIYAYTNVLDLSSDDPEAEARFTIDTIEFAQGDGQITGLPITHEIIAD